MRNFRSPRLCAQTVIVLQLAAEMAEPGIEQGILVFGLFEYSKQQPKP